MGVDSHIEDFLDPGVELEDRRDLTAGDLNHGHATLER